MSRSDDEKAAIVWQQIAWQQERETLIAALKRETERAERFHAQIDRARVALTPFSIRPNPNNSDDCLCAAYSFRAGDYRRVLAVLAEIEGTGR